MLHISKASIYLELLLLFIQYLVLFACYIWLVHLYKFIQFMIYVIAFKGTKIYLQSMLRFNI